MGGFFGGGAKTPTYTAPAVVNTTQADADAEARQQREEAIARNRRGRAGMVTTSDRGVLAQVPNGAKSLLGE
ncbi:MAG: hypothetical protein ACM31D_05845 [Bacteroidota bacterium]